VASQLYFIRESKGINQQVKKIVIVR